MKLFVLRQSWLMPLAVVLTSVQAIAVYAAPLEAQSSEADASTWVSDPQTNDGVLLASGPGISKAIADSVTEESEPGESISATQPELKLAQAVADDTRLIGQVTSVSQLSDVQPTDWAFQALQSLVERYGCIAGYPDGTFRGNRAATRYELAAALNACLDQISDRFATKEDLETVKALQEEFKAELATLKGRVDGLEARTATLEAQQFSTTTKLSGLAVFGAQYGQTLGDQGFDISTDGSDPGADDLDDERATAIGAVFLNFNTSFSGSDLLQTTLFMGNGGGDLIGAAEIGSTPSNPGNQALFVPGQFYFTGFPGNVGLFRLAYTFKPIEDLAVTVAPLFYPTDIIDVNSYTSPVTGLSSWFMINNPLITPYELNFKGGAGAAFDWNPNGGPISVRAVYAAADAGSSIANPAFGGGLFGDPYQATAELEYARTFGSNDANNFAVRLQYTNSATSNISQNAGGINAEVTFGRFGLFGRYGISGSNAYGDANPIPYSPVLGAGEYLAQTWQAGFGVHDLFVPGSLLAASVGQPFINDLPSSDALEINNRTQTNIEAFYRFPVNDNISISPIIMAILDANNSSRNPDIIQGLVRVTFSF